MSVNGIARAKFLAIDLSDLEFEFLIRERILGMFRRLPNYAELSESYCRAAISLSPGSHDAAKWDVSIGSNYGDCVDLKGEVFSATLRLVNSTYTAKNSIKLSKLIGYDGDNDGQSTADGDNPASA